MSLSGSTSAASLCSSVAGQVRNEPVGELDDEADFGAALAGQPGRDARRIDQRRSDAVRMDVRPAFFAAAMVAKFDCGLAAPVAGTAHVPGFTLLGRTSPT